MTSDPMDALNRTIGDLESQLKGTSSQIEQARKIGDLLADVTGSAQTEDGHVRVEFGAQGLVDLEINPRAMRLGSEDLAEAIKQTFRDAAQDYQARTMEVMRDAGLVPSVEKQQAQWDDAMKRFGQAQRNFTDSMRQAAESLGQVHANRRAQP